MLDFSLSSDEVIVILPRHLCSERTAAKFTLNSMCSSMSFPSFNVVLWCKRTRVCLLSVIFSCVYTLLFQKSVPFYVSRENLLCLPLLSSNLNRGKPSLKTRSLEHISRVLAASESFIKTDCDIQEGLQVMTYHFFRQASCWSGQRVEEIANGK